jgi:cation transport ATPase
MTSPTNEGFMSKLISFWTNRKMVLIAMLALVGIVLHLILRYGVQTESPSYQFPLWIVLAVGGIPLVYGLLQKVFQLEFGSDLLAGLSIVTAVLLGEYLAGSFVVLMLSGGEAL